MFVEIQLGSPRKRIFLNINLETQEIWVDTKGLPLTAMLCAMLDGTPMLEGNCGSGKKQVKRQFLPIEWCINEWGGSKNMVEALKITMEKALARIPEYIEKYKNCDI